MNGFISFESPIESFDTSVFPNNLGASAILPFFADSNGHFVGNTRYRAATSTELTNLRTTLVNSRTSLSAINLKMGYLMEWDEMTPCGCYFPVSSILPNIYLDYPVSKGHL